MKFPGSGSSFAQLSLKIVRNTICDTIVSVIHISYLQMLGLVCFLPHIFYFTTILYFVDTAEERRYTNQKLINETNYINLSLYIFPV